MKRLPKYNSYRRFLKRKYPELSIQRRKTPNDCWGWYEDFKIVVSNEIPDQMFAMSILTHELAHYLAADKEKEAHDRWFGAGYYKAYQVYLEWLEWNTSENGDNA